MSRFTRILITAACSAVLPVQADPVPLFQPIDIDFKIVWDQAVHPFTGATAIDVDGDGQDEVFIGGGLNQPDRLYRFVEDTLVNIIDGRGLSDDDAAHGAMSIDIDGDGDVDLALARAGGVYLYLNDGEGRFEARRVPVPSQPEASEPFQVAVSDYDRDGDVDLYISYFVAFPSFRSATFNDPDHAKLNRLLRNDGDLTFTDVTEEAGVAGSANSFGAILVDLNNDFYDDLVIAQNTWQVEIFENNKDGTFTQRPLDTGYGFWMGVGVGDMDNDGDQDLFFPNVGDSIPPALTQGDIRDDQRHSHAWSLMRNDGDFQFTEVVEDWNIHKAGFAWGGVFEDVNLDGRLDLFVAQNYIKWPVHKLFKLNGKAYLQVTDEQGKPAFEDSKALGLRNPRYGQSSLFVDLDGDARLDYFWINMGDKQAAYLNRSTGNFVSFRLPDDIAHLGTQVYIETEQGRSYTRQFIAGQGYLTDQASELVFGLNGAEQVIRAVVTWPDGSEVIIENPAINTRHPLRR